MGCARFVAEMDAEIEAGAGRVRGVTVEAVEMTATVTVTAETATAETVTAETETVTGEAVTGRCWLRAGCAHVRAIALYEYARNVVVRSYSSAAARSSPC